MASVYLMTSLWARLTQSMILVVGFDMSSHNSSVYLQHTKSMSELVTASNKHILINVMFFCVELQVQQTVVITNRELLCS